MQIISKDKTLRGNAVQDLQDFNSQPLATQDEKGGQIVSWMPALKRLLI